MIIKIKSITMCKAHDMNFNLQNVVIKSYYYSKMFIRVRTGLTYIHEI